MKKIIVILLAFLTFSAYGQAEFEKIAITENVATASTSKIVSQQPGTGELNYINATALPLSVDVVNALKLKGYLSTGLLKNGLLQANANTTLFDITAGTGIISNFDNPDASTSDIIIFPSFTGILSPYLTTSNITYVAINNVPAVVMQASPFTDSQRRDLIILGAIVHSNLSTINTINNISAPANADANQLHDLMEAIGALNISGNKYSANGANLSLNKSAGDIFKLGINFANNWKDPHKLTIDAQTLLTLRYRTQNGTEGSDVTVLNPAVYDLNNVLTSVPSNRFSIQTVTLFQSGITRVQYGQNTYATMAEAEAAINTRAYVVEPNIALNGIARAYIILKNSVTSLQNASDAKIVEAQKFGGSTSGGVALTNASIIAALGFTPENVANKQNSLTADGTGVKYPTVDAVNSGVFENTKKWVLFGDSISNTLLDPDYPFYVIEKLKLTGTVTNAVAGNTSADQLTILNSILTATPTYFNSFDIASLLIGVNDWATNVPLGNRKSLITDNNFAGRVKAIIEKILTAKPNISLYVMTPFETNSGAAPYNSFNTSGYTLREMSVLISQICSDYAVQCIDLYSLTQLNSLTTTTLLSDGVHPNTAGAQFIGNIVAKAFLNNNNKGRLVDTGIRRKRDDLYEEIENNIFKINKGSFQPTTIYDVNYKVGFGKSVPAIKFEVVSTSVDPTPVLGSGGTGFISFLSNNLLYGEYIGSSNTGDTWHQVQRNDGNTATYNMVFQPLGGNVVIGSLSDNGSKFQVNGSVTATNYTGSATLTGTPTAPTAPPGTNTTQIATMAALQVVARPYKVYTALLSQTGTNAPTAIVQENTLGGTVTWSRVGNGSYRATLTGAFVLDKTTAQITGNNTSVILAAYRASDDIVAVNTQTLDDSITKGTIEIRVYN